jgi:hypothetical protein
MPQAGDIVVERLTGTRAIVIRVVSPEEIVCRFADGRLEERFTFELDQLPLASLISVFLSSFLSWFRQRPATPITQRPRPTLVRASST